MGENNKEQVGDYELLGLIGDGAQGRVYRARCLSDALPLIKKGEEVALKVVRITGEDEKIRLKFQEQADILRRLSHPNIVSYRDCFAWHAGEWDEAQCLVMELLEGEPLSSRLKKATSGLPWPQVEEIFEQCLAGLIHARERGITHRDIKPSNIFITQDGRAKLIDFDIARCDESEQMSTAGWKGTFDYMAPDFISTTGFRGDESSDIFSLGVCFYQTLTGALPYEPLGDTAHIGYLNRWSNKAAPVPSFRPGVFRVLSNAKGLVVKSLNAKREDRYPTFAAMLEDFRKIRYRRIRHKNKDEYELLAVLGRGGFGEVFKARRVSDGMLVAVKYLFSERQPERFIKEAKILQQYPHPNLVKYVDFMVLDGSTGEKQFFLIMEFLEGIPGWTLRHRIKNEGAMDAAEVVPLFCGFLSALQFLHGSARPIIHRDIKPGNLYAPLGQPDKGKIFDLGVARDVSGTVTVGGVPGTLDYMAPEFAEGGNDRGSPQSDLYALGLCLYEALTGTPLFGRLPSDLNSAWVAFLERIRNPPAISFSAAVFGQYPSLKEVLLKTLAERPKERYRSAAEMRAALENALKPETADRTAEDEFDGDGVTMATFAGGGHVEPEPGVTMGTRPLEALGGKDLSGGGIDLIAAGKREAVRRKKLKMMMTVGGVAAALVVFGFGGIILGIKIRESGAGPVEQVLPTGSPSGAKHPETGKSAEPVAAKVQKPVAPVTVPPATPMAEPSNKGPDEPVVLAVESDPVYQKLKHEIPETFVRDADWLKAEEVASKLAAQEKQAWPGVDDDEKLRRLAALRALLTEPASSYVAQVRDAALAAYAAGKDAKRERERLAFMSSHAPLLKQAVSVSLDEAVARVEAAGAHFSVSETLKVLPDRVTQAADEQALQALMEAFIKLEGKAGVTLQPEQVRAVEQAFSDKYLSFAGQQALQAQEDYAAGRLTDGAKAQKQLAERVASVPLRFGKNVLTKLERDVERHRLEAEAKVVQREKGRDAMMATAAKRLEDLDRRMQKGVLADCADGAALLSGIEPELLADAGFKAKWDASRGSYVKLLAQAVAQKDPLETRAQRLKMIEELLNTPSSRTLFAGEEAVLHKALEQQKGVCVLRLVNRAGNALQITCKEIGAAVSLAGGEVKEWALPVSDETLTVSVSVRGGDRFRSRIETVKLPRSGGLERALGALEAEPVKPALPVVAAVVPPAGGPAGPVTSGATGPATLEIAVSPKIAIIMVDGKVVESGRVDVMPNENHKVSVECTGYKPVQQYYKVLPGETRKIDFLLERESKKSFFGF